MFGTEADMLKSDAETKVSVAVVTAAPAVPAVDGVSVRVAANCKAALTLILPETLAVFSVAITESMAIQGT